MKVIFMGTPEFACPCVEALATSNHEVVAVVTGAPKPSGRGKKLKPTPVHQTADRLGLPVHTVDSLKDAGFRDWLTGLRPDLIAVVAFRILPESIYSIPTHGTINIHGSILPKYRGAAPIHWAIINGEKETGLTSFFLKRKVDTGDIIDTWRTEIVADDTYDTLSKRLSESCGDFLLSTIDLIESGKSNPTPQDSSLATPAPKFSPYDAFIDFGMPAERVRDFVHGLSSRPGAHTTFRSKRIKIFGAEAYDSSDEVSAVPGEIIIEDKQLLVQCAHSRIRLTLLLPQGKKPMDGLSFINGFRPQSGERFGDPIETEVMN